LTVELVTLRVHINQGYKFNSQRSSVNGQPTTEGRYLSRRIRLDTPSQLEHDDSL